MKPTDVTPTIPPPDTRVKRDKDEAFKLSFWISQFFILAATILGVYLAANQGFKQALAYGEIQSDKSNYYLRKSLQNEIVVNIQLTREYLKRIQGGSMALRRAPFKLETFVWESMKYSPATLETPSELLRENSDFHRKVMDLYEKIAVSDYSVQKGTELIEEILTHMEKDVLPKFEKNTAELKENIETYGLKI